MNPRWSAVRTPAFWIMLVLTGISFLFALLVGGIAAIGVPRSMLVAGLLGTGYAALGLVLLLVVADPVVRRPWWLIVLALVWGGAVAVVVGAGAGWFLDSAIAQGISPYFAAEWGAALVAPPAEETAKVAGVAMIVLAARPYVRTVWAGAVYGAVVGIGFAAVEDVGYGLTAADDALPDDATAAAQLIVARFLVPGFAGHPLFTAAAGAGVAYAMVRTDRSPGRRLGVLTLALSGASLAHFMVNSPLAVAASELIAGWAGDFTGYLLAVGAVALPLAWWLWRLRQEESRTVLGWAHRLAPHAVLLEEVPVLAGRRSRMRRVRAVGRDGGTEARRAARQLHRAQLRFAGALGRPHGGYPAVVPPYWLAPTVRRLWIDAVDARHRLSLLTGATPTAPEPATARPSRRWLLPLVPATVVAAHIVAVNVVIGLLFPS